MSNTTPHPKANIPHFKLFCLVMSQKAQFTVQDIEQKAREKDIPITEDSVVDILDDLTANGALGHCLNQYTTSSRIPIRF